jgi:uncharacterized NAD(P)/FAD-binding protein YdhS
MKQVSITIIGMGPRGLSLLERIAARARDCSVPLRLNLVEPGEAGPGAHGTRQPQHLLINTVASQVTIFPFHEAVGAAPVCATPSLTEWARAQGYRRVGGQFIVASGAGDEISDADYLPRQLLGCYLAWAASAVAAALPPSVQLVHLRQKAVDLYPLPDGSYSVELESGYTLASDYVFLATGHGRNQLSDEEAWFRKFAQDHARYNPRLAYVRHIYPLSRLDALAADAVVGIQGIGLSAHDVIAELTVGRGGRFEGEGADLRYLASGREPRLLLFSRNCLPAAARGVNQKGLAGRHAARFFTRAAVAALRAAAVRARGNGQLDFERELLPLLRLEMACAWRGAASSAPVDAAGFIATPAELAAIDALLFPLRGRGFADEGEFCAMFVQLLRDDLDEARRGNLTSPAKAAADALRDARAPLQDMIEHGGLLPASHRKFLSVYNPAINRVTFGPPRRRNEELLALMDAGVLAVGAGPNPVLRIDEERSQFALHTRYLDGTAVRHLDALVVARLDAYSPATDDSALSGNLLRRGLVRPFYNGSFHPGGIDIDAANHPLDRAGAPNPRLWALGYPVEGPHYYTHALPRPHTHARAVLDAERCVVALFGAIAATHPDSTARPAAAKVAARATL